MRTSFTAFVLLLLLFLLLPPETLRAQVTWTGGASTPNWEDGGNWSTGFVPTPLDDVVISGSTTNVNVSTNPGPIKSLAITMGASLDILATGVVSTQFSTGTGVSVSGNSMLVVSGRLAPFQSGLHGLLNAGQTEITPNGVIVIDNTDDTGILNDQDDAFLLNDGTIEIYSTGGNALVNNDGEFYSDKVTSELTGEGTFILGTGAGSIYGLGGTIAPRAASGPVSSMTFQFISTGLPVSINFDNTTNIEVDINGSAAADIDLVTVLNPANFAPGGQITGSAAYMPPSGTTDHTVLIASPITAAPTVNLPASSVSGMFITTWVDASSFTDVIMRSTTALPVEFVHFSGEAAPKCIHLDWATAVESGNEGFEIQRSTDGGRNWQAIGFERGQGDAAVRTNYRFTDYTPASGSNFYRLKQLDFDGAYDFSSVVELEFNGNSTATNLYPNPAREVINYFAPEGSLLQLYDGDGRLLREITAGNGRLSLDGLSAGTYVLRATRNGEVSNQRFVKR